MRLSAYEYRRQFPRNHRPQLVWVALSLLALLFLSSIAIAPLAAADNHLQVSLIIYRSFSLLCHQLPDRSYYLFGFPLAVCARCTGIYVGFVVMLLAYPLVVSVRGTSMPDRRWLVLAALPLLIDFSLTIFGLWENTHTSRFLTGFLLGGVAVFYVVPGLIELSSYGWRTRPARLSGNRVSIDSVSSSPSDYHSPGARI